MGVQVPCSRKNQKVQKITLIGRRHRKIPRNPPKIPGKFGYRRRILRKMCDKSAKGAASAGISPISRSRRCNTKEDFSCTKGRSPTRPVGRAQLPEIKGEKLRAEMSGKNAGAPTAVRRSRAGQRGCRQGRLTNELRASPLAGASALQARRGQRRTRSLHATR